MKQDGEAQAWWREPTKAHWLSFFAAWLGWVLDAFDFTIFLLVMPEIAREFGVSYTATAGSITLTLLVRLAGGYFAGLAADRWGRRLPLMLSLVWFALCDGAVAFADSFGLVLLARTLFGFGMGAEWTAGTTLAMENWPARSRGLASGVLQGSWAIGYLLAGLVAGYVVPIWGWRALFLIAAAPALLAVPIRLFVPESEVWLARRHEGGHVRVGLARFSASTWRRVAWASAVLGLGFSVYYALIGLYPTMLKTELGLDAPSVGQIIAWFNVGMMAGAVACGLFASRWGVRLALILPALGLVASLGLYLGHWPASISIGAFLGGLFGAGTSGVTPLLLTSIFPPGVRARAVGIVYHVGASFAAFVPFGVAAYSEESGEPLSWAIGIAATIFELLLIGLLLVAKPPEAVGSDLER